MIHEKMIPKETIYFHLKTRSGLYTVVEYTRNYVRYTCNKWKHEDRKTRVAGREEYKCLQRSFMKFSDEYKIVPTTEEICFHKHMTTLKQTSFEWYKSNSSIVPYLNKMSNKEIHAYFGSKDLFKIP